MSKEETSDDYEVGYGKPPKETQFQKGVSGNPKGRHKKVPDFDSEFLRESEALITINDNGQRKRISKFQGIVKQLHNKALTGNIPATRIYLALYQQALEKAALSATQPSSGLKNSDNPKDYTEEEMVRIVWEYIKDTEPKS